MLTELQAILPAKGFATASALVLIAAMGSAPPATAKPQFSQTRAIHTLNKKHTISEAQAARIAARASGGKVLKVNRMDGQYRVKVLQPSGHVKNIVIDAKSGKVRK